MLQTNMDLYGLKIKLFNYGISSKTETASFNFYPQAAGRSGMISSVEQDKEANRAMILDWLRNVAPDKVSSYEDELDTLLEQQFHSETYVCQLRTLSEVINKHGVERIALLKIDVEKSEFDVLAGICEEHWPKIAQMVIEIETRERLDQITALLESHGYDLFVDEDVAAVEGTEGMHSGIYMLYAIQRRDAGLLAGKDCAPSTASSPELSMSGLRRFLGERLPAYMVPSSFMTLSALPLTPNGKVDRRALPPPNDLLPESGAAYVPPQTEAERVIAEIWQAVLRVDKVGVNDNFFEVGGNSLRLVQVHSKLCEAFHQVVPVAELFRYPTISSLAQYLSLEPNAQPSLQHVQERAKKQTAAMQQRVMRNRPTQVMEEGG
jgi:iturin family lipopeptide synthetase A